MWENALSHSTVSGRIQSNSSANEPNCSYSGNFARAQKYLSALFSHLITKKSNVSSFLYKAYCDFTLVTSNLPLLNLETTAVMSESECSRFCGLRKLKFDRTNGNSWNHDSSAFPVVTTN